MISKEGKISPVVSLSILILFGIGLDAAMFVGMLYLFESEQQSRMRAVEDRKADTRATNLILSQVNDTAAEALSQHTSIIISLSNLLQNQELRGNQSLALAMPLLLDTDEDLELVKADIGLIKQGLGINQSTPKPDLIKLDYNGTHIVLDNTTIFKIPAFNTTRILGNVSEG